MSNETVLEMGAATARLLADPGCCAANKLIAESHSSQAAHEFQAFRPHICLAQYFPLTHWNQAGALNDSLPIARHPNYSTEQTTTLYINILDSTFEYMSMFSFSPVGSFDVISGYLLSVRALCTE